MFVSKKGIL